MAMGASLLVLCVVLPLIVVVIAGIVLGIWMLSRGRA